MASKTQETGSFQIITVSEDLREHKREKLEKFIGSEKNFSNEKEQDEARKIYIKMLKEEKELKMSLKEQFKTPPRELSKSVPFDYDVFKKTSDENVLTEAILKQFVKSPAAFVAAWDYHTLQRSHDLLYNLNSGKVQDGKTPGVRQKDRFGSESKELNTQQLKSTIIVTQQKGKGEPMDTSEAKGQPAGGATVQSQDVAPQVDYITEHLLRQHHHGRHGFDVGYPHPEGPPSDDETDKDDSKDDILHLLWTHQEFFDPKALSRAQAEYNYYLQLEKQWRRTSRRVHLDEINYEDASLKKFREFPRKRPLYGVISTVLDLSKDKKAVSLAEAAAVKYSKLNILEANMVEQKMLTNVPQTIELDSASYSELMTEMQSRFKGSTKKAQLKETSAFKMVPLWEYLKLKETITSQRNQIEELASRLSGIASQQLADGDPGFTDLGDKNRPQKLGERFAELFDETWSSAYEVLKPKNPDADDDDSDEPTMDKLQEVVKVIYEYCQRVSKEQIERIVKAMMPPILDPVSPVKDQDVKASEQMKTKTEQMAREYRKVVAPATVKVLQKEILEKEIRGKHLPAELGKELQKYVNECIDLIWYMCIQQPPMEIRWCVPGEKFNREQFRFSGRKGKKFKLTVWPAVFLHKDGPLVAPGYAVPQ